MAGPAAITTAVLRIGSGRLFDQHHLPQLFAHPVQNMCDARGFEIEDIRIGDLLGSESFTEMEEKDHNITSAMESGERAPQYLNDIVLGKFTGVRVEDVVSPATELLPQMRAIE